MAPVPRGMSVFAYCALAVTAFFVGCAEAVHTRAPMDTLQSAKNALDMAKEAANRATQDAIDRTRRAPCGDHGEVGVDSKCRCDDGFMGARCEYKELADHHGHGRYVGPSNCVHGAMMADGECRCNAGWAGHHCDREDCINGRMECPNKQEHCMRTVCVCDEHYEGLRCDIPALKMPSGSTGMSGTTGMSGASGSTGVTGASGPEEEECTVKKCVNEFGKVTGTFDRKLCKCRCMPGWRGEYCQERTAAAAKEMKKLLGTLAATGPTQESLPVSQFRSQQQK